MNEKQVFSLSDGIGRREFLKQTGMTLTAISLAGMLGEILQSCASITGPAVTHGSTTVNVASLTSDGQFMVDNNVQPDGTPILVVRQNASTFTALSMLCTHAGCQVNPPSGGTIYCACHGTRFDMHGNVLSGPAPSPLTNYSTTYNASTKTLTVTY